MQRGLSYDLHILALETMTWDEIDAMGVPPSPRAENIAAVHAERYLLIFGGGSHATCFNDLHALDLSVWNVLDQNSRVTFPLHKLDMLVQQ
ncbi:hypothetical protein MRB53_003049 [Persea americana]|uniref:Uncharacterized protein n=1 Tax=Persea americana TaxID=3435 RepID=A0ACC2MWG6_PERAE|nr:hypothetical protein MRB53_003049 [Persea americana]